VLVYELPREGDDGIGEELPAGGIDGGTADDVAERPRQGVVAVREDREGHVHDGLRVSSAAFQAFTICLSSFDMKLACE
jgi:hypothetical protein